MKYVTVASTFSGNKGAASMLEASIQTITAQDPEAEFTVLTVYPEEDKKFNLYNNVQILSAKPLFLGAFINPLALLYKLLPPLRPLLKRQQHIRAIAEADAYLDQGGITFVDGREKFLIYNMATILPAIFIGTRIIKCSQAMGTFNKSINRLTAKLILPRLETICARGEVTNSYLKELGLKNVIESTDYAFLMNVTDKEAKKADKILEKSKFRIKKGKTVAVMPSEVVRKKTEASGQDYIAYKREFIEYLLGNGYHVLLMAYSARGNKDSRHNNDLPVCRDIAEGLEHKNFTFIDDELSAQQLRHIIGKTDIAVTSRFHAMIAALSTTTPPLVIGWSHKYAEIMDMFNIKEMALGSNDLDQKKLQTVFDKSIENLKNYKKLINENLLEVRKSSMRQVDEILKVSEEK